MEIPLKYKYRVYKPAKRGGTGSNDSGKSTRKKQGKKTYVYGSRVMWMYDAYRGKTRMIAGD